MEQQSNVSRTVIAHPISQFHCVRVVAWWKLQGFPAVFATGYTHGRLCVCATEKVCI